MKIALVIALVAFVVISIESTPVNHKKHKGKSAKTEDEGFDNGVGSVDYGEWPNPGTVSNFDVPPGFNDGSTAESDQGLGEADRLSSSGRHHGKAHRRRRN